MVDLVFHATKQLYMAGSSASNVLIVFFFAVVSLLVKNGVAHLYQQQLQNKL